MKDLLGGKRARLTKMTNLSFRVPTGFTTTTEACVEYYRNNQVYPPGMWDQVLENLRRVEESMGSRFGDPDNPLLVSVRSEPQVSMPGMMDTVLNVGLNDKTVHGLAKKSNNERFAYDTYRHFITMFGSVVMGVKRLQFEKLLQEKEDELGIRQDRELNTEALKDLIERYKKLVRKKTGKNFPMAPLKQLRMAIDAVFNLRKTPTVATYREIHNLPNNIGTGVNVVAMAFGNMGEKFNNKLGYHKSLKHTVSKKTDEKNQNKLFINDKYKCKGITMEKDRSADIFVVMPFSKRFDDIYYLGISEITKNLGYSCLRVDEVEFVGDVLDKIYSSIENARLIIAEVTTNNPNVMYEIGYAHAINKPVILLTRNIKSTPFDIKGHNHIIYDNILTLRKRLKNRLLSMVI